MLSKEKLLVDFWDSNVDGMFLKKKLGIIF